MAAWHASTTAGGVRRLLVGLFLLSFGAADPCRAVDLGRSFDFDIPGESLGPALLLFSQQAGIQIAMPGADLSGLHTAGIKGPMSIRAALSALLSGTGLSYQVTGDTSIAVGRLPSAPGAVQGTAWRR